MKFTVQIQIKRPVGYIQELMLKPELMHHWQPELVSFTPVQGEVRAEGSTAKLLYLMHGKQIEMLETIVENRLPKRFVATYDVGGMINTLRHQLKAVDAETTLQITESEFRFPGAMKLMAKTMQPTLKKQATQTLENFKAYAEDGVSLALAPQSPPPN